MSPNKINALLEKFYEGTTSLEEEQELKRALAQQGHPSLDAEGVIFRFFDQEKQKSPVIPIGARPSLKSWWPALAAAACLLLVLGIWLRYQYPRVPDQIVPIAAGSSLTTASHRIGIIQELGRSPKVSADQLNRLADYLNHDPSPNVRIAAAKSLFHLRAQCDPGTTLFPALSLQKEPIVRIALIKLCLALDPERARGFAKHMMEQTETSAELKTLLADLMSLG